MENFIYLNGRFIHRVFNTAKEMARSLNAVIHDSDVKKNTYGDLERHTWLVPIEHCAKDCILYTLEGEKDAKAIPNDDGNTCTITTLDHSYRVVTSLATFIRKFDGEDKPTFYAC